MAVGLGAALLATAGYLAPSYAREELRQANEGWRARLTAMADDCAAAVAEWIEQDRADARVLADYIAIGGLLTSRPQEPSFPTRDGRARRMQAVLDSFVRVEGNRGG